MSADPDRAGLLATLDAQRAHVLGAVAGLDDVALRTAVLPSGWSTADLVHHLAMDVERFWFRAVVAGERAVVDELAVATEDGWHVPPGMSPGSVLDAYRAEVAAADAVIARTPLDAPPAWWPGEQFGDFRLPDLRSVLLHVITETACHAGHLDAVRELIDGHQWLVLEE